MVRVSNLLAAVLLVITLGQCSWAQGTPASIPLEGTEWRLVELNGAAVASSDERGGSLLLTAEGRRLAGSSGCNRLMGGYRLGRRALRFTPAGTTRMACPEPLMQQEQAFLKALSETKSYHITDHKLELRRGKKVLAKFEAAESTPPATASVGANHPTDAWLGQWNGPEGTYLLLAKNGGHYVVKVRSLDGLETYEGMAAGDHIEFVRNGMTESIRAGSGQATGMKWLLDKRDCLVIKTGEGFCRN